MSMWDDIFGGITAVLGGVGATAIEGAIDPATLKVGIPTDIIAGTTAATIASLGTAAPAAGAADTAAIGAGTAADTAVGAGETATAVGGAAADTAATGAGSVAADTAATGASDAATGVADTAATSTAADVAPAATTPAISTDAGTIVPTVAPTASTDTSSTGSGLSTASKVAKAALNTTNSVNKIVNLAKTNNQQAQAPGVNVAPPSNITPAPITNPNITQSLQTTDPFKPQFDTIFGSSIQPTQPTLNPIPNMSSNNSPALIQPPPLITSDIKSKTKIKTGDYSVKNFLKQLSSGVK